MLDTTALRSADARLASGGCCLSPLELSALPPLMLREQTPFAHCPIGGTWARSACLRRDT